MIRVGRLSKSITEELDKNNDIHQFQLTITCANSESSTMLESFVKKYDGIVDTVTYDAHSPEVEVIVLFTNTISEYLQICGELSGIGKGRWYFNAITDCEVVK